MGRCVTCRYWGRIGGTEEGICQLITPTVGGSRRHHLVDSILKTFGSTA